jgi:hypothetical protein
MRHRYSSLSIFTKVLWMALTLCVLVFCGPVKRLIDLRLGNEAPITLHSEEKKLKTFYREKRDVPSFVSILHQDLPDSGLLPFLVPLIISFLLFFRSAILRRVLPLMAFHHPAMPLYLQIRKLQV